MSALQLYFYKKQKNYKWKAFISDILCYNGKGKKEGVIMSPEPDEDTKLTIKQSITGDIIDILLL